MDIEIRRKALHILLTSYPLWYAASTNFIRLHITITLILIIMWCISEYLRIRYRLRLMPTYIILKLMTRKEADVLYADFKVPNWLIGYMIPALIFSPIHILNGVCVLCFGDTAASIFGKKGQKKSLQGSMAGFIVSFMFCLFITGNAMFALGASLLGMIVEYISTGIKDNYTVPLGGSLGSYLPSILKG